MPESVFGEDLFSPLKFEEDIEALIRLWINTYLNRIELLHGFEQGGIDRPRSYAVTADYRKRPEDAIPFVQIESGSVVNPINEGLSYRADYEWTLTVLVSASSERNTRRLAQAYGMALRALILQKHKSMNGISTGVTWTSEDYTLPEVGEKSRSQAAVEMTFTTHLSSVIEPKAGPAVPDTEPSAVYGTVLTTDVDLEKEPIDD